MTQPPPEGSRGPQFTFGAPQGYQAGPQGQQHVNRHGPQRQAQPGPPQGPGPAQQWSAPPPGYPQQSPAPASPGRSRLVAGIVIAALAVGLVTSLVFNFIRPGEPASFPQVGSAKAEDSLRAAIELIGKGDTVGAASHCAIDARAEGFDFDAYRRARYMPSYRDTLRWSPPTEDWLAVNKATAEAECIALMRELAWGITVPSDLDIFDYDWEPDEKEFIEQVDAPADVRVVRFDLFQPKSRYAKDAVAENCDPWGGEECASAIAMLDSEDGKRIVALDFVRYEEEWFILPTESTMSYYVGIDSLYRSHIGAGSDNDYEDALETLKSRSR